MLNYSAEVLMSCLSLCVLTILVKQNNCLSVSVKRRFYITYLFIIIAALSEWLGIFLNGAPYYTRGIHASVKALDYIFTPLTGFSFALQVFDYRRIPWIIYVLIVNTVLQIVSVFTGWFFYIDEFNFYQHGSYYFVYMAVYLLVILYLFISFFEYSKQFRKHNRMSLFAVIFLTCFGIFMQEFIKDIRTSALSLTFGSILLYIHYTEFMQQRMDDSLSSQKKLILTDAVTGLYSRYSYNEDLELYRKMDRLPDDLAVFSIDVNGLKTSNDTLGHDAGDELIIASARCIQHVLGAYGKCYRTGGDEFVAICRMNSYEINEALRNLNKAQKKWHGYLNDSLSLSAGHCSNPDNTIDEMITKADRDMYKHKEEYYRLNNLTPRV